MLARSAAGSTGDSDPTIGLSLAEAATARSVAALFAHGRRGRSGAAIAPGPPARARAHARRAVRPAHAHPGSRDPRARSEAEPPREPGRGVREHPVPRPGRAAPAGLPDHVPRRLPAPG